MLTLASHHTVLPSVNSMSIVDTGSDLTDAHSQLDDFYFQEDASCVENFDPSSPFIQIPLLLHHLREPIVVFHHAHKGTDYMLWIFKDSSAVLVFQENDEDCLKVVPWPIKLASTIERKGQHINLRKNWGSPEIGYCGENFAGTTSLINHNANDCYEARLARVTYQDQMREDMRAVVKAFKLATPLARDRSLAGPWSEGKEVIPYFATFRTTPNRHETIQTFVKHLDVYLRAHLPVIETLRMSFYGRLITRQGELTQPSFHININSENNLGTFSDWIVGMLDHQDCFLPPLHQIAQKRLSEVLLHGHLSLARATSAHEVIEATAYINDLMRRFPLPHYDTINHFTPQAA